MNFDLNIENYSIEELADMFDLPANYDKNIVEIKEAQLRGNIMNNREISQDIRMKTLNFLVEAKKIILKEPHKESNDINKLTKLAYHSNLSLKTTELENSNEHMVQIRENKPYISSSPSEYFAGIINPLKRKTKTQILNINSKFRDNYYSTSSTNFNVNLPILFTDVVTIVFNAIEIPTSYYCVSKQYSNNFFTIVVNGNAGIVNLPDGNYSQLGIIECINNQISTLTSIDPDFANVKFILNSIIYPYS